MSYSLHVLGISRVAGKVMGNRLVPLLCSSWLASGTDSELGGFKGSLQTSSATTVAITRPRIVILMVPFL